MAEMESKFRITASAVGFQKLTTSAEKLAKAFKNVGDASEQMGKKAAVGLAAQQAALDAIHKNTRGIFGKASDALFGRRDVAGGSGGNGGGGRSRKASGTGPVTASTGHAAAMRIGQSVSGVLGGIYAGAGYNGGGGRSGPPGPSTPTPKPPKDPKSFGRGLLMGGLNIDYLNHDYSFNDAKKQAAGISIGRLLRRTAGAAFDFIGSSVEGPEAVASAISGVPLIGGKISRGLGKGIQAARQEAAAQGSFSSMMPYIANHSGDFVSKMNFERTRLGKLGMQYGGLSENQSLAAFAAASAQSGGVTGNYSDERLGRALQAQQAYGVDLGTSMRLLRGEDTGQALGGRLSNQLGQALGNAQKLGLDGGETSQYLRLMATNLEEVNQTGIKFSTAGQGSLERAMGKAFATEAGTRTIAMGQGLSKGLDQIAQNGPQNAAQAMVLQHLGFDPAKPETYADALMAAEDPLQRAKGVAGAMRAFQKTIGRFSPGQQQMQIRSFMAQLQTNVSNTEARKSATEGTFANVFGDTLERPLPMVDVDLSKRATSNTAVSQQREAVMSNMDTKIGGYQLDAVQASDLRAREVTVSIQGVGNTFLNAANSIADVGRQLTGFVMPGASSQGANTAFR